MGCNKKHFCIERGDDWVVNFLIRDIDTKEPIDITGWKFYFTLKNDPSDLDASALYQFDWTTHSDPENGRTSFTLPRATTELYIGYKHYDFQVKTADNVVSTVMIGKINFGEDISRRYD